jgi:N-formylmaleamate deformylase
MKGTSMFDYVEGNIGINGVKIHYYRTGGNKPSFILLHGATDNGLCWTPVAELLAKDYDVIMPDAQGHGLSDRLGRDFTSKNHTVQTVELMRELGIEKPVIMGHSMGAGTTTNIAVEYPSLPKAVILEDPAWVLPESINSEKEKEEHKHREEFMRAAAGYSKRSREELIEECRKENPRWSEAEIVPWAQSKLQFDPALLSTLQVDRTSYVELVPKLQCPVLLITSDGGLVTPETAEHASSLGKSGKPFRWVQIKGAGHNIRREQFEIFCEKLFDFLKGLPD